MRPRKIHFQGGTQDGIRVNNQTQHDTQPQILEAVKEHKHQNGVLCFKEVPKEL